jgi:hypothetical protein
MVWPACCAELTTSASVSRVGVQCACTALVALGAAYASYRHGREFALRFAADHTTAAIWPLIVDGLLTTATVELWKTGHGRRTGGRWARTRIRHKRQVDTLERAVPTR